MTLSQTLTDKSAFPNYQLSDLELTQIDIILNELKSQYDSIERSDFQNACSIASAGLPFELKKYLTEIASNLRTEGFYVISGFQINDAQIGPTPSHWDAPWGNHSYSREEIFQCLISAYIGSTFGWRTQENGRFLRHIVPIEQDKDEQLGGSSSTPLLWHTEEAFHPGRADYMTLMCYRNTEQAETLLTNVRALKLSEKTRRILSEERFMIEPDKSHLPENNVSEQWKMRAEQFNKIYDLLSKPRKCAVLHGTEEYPMMVVDQAFMSPCEGDAIAAAALDEFHAALDEAVTRLVMQSGDLVIIDNLATAHGRSVYKPNYGPKARWMRRVNIRNGRRAYWNYMESNNSRAMI